MKLFPQVSGVSPIIAIFALTWGLYFSLLAILPIHYPSGEYRNSLILLVTYVVVTLATALCAEIAARTSSDSKPPEIAPALRPLDHHELERLVLVGLLFSCIGVFSLAYVRLFVQGIDYSRGLAVARELWNAEGADRSDISSLWSIPGYGFGFFFFASTFIAHLHWEQLRPNVRRALLTVALLLVAAHSVLSGGRSVLLTQLISIAAAAATRRSQGKRAFPGRFWLTFLAAVIVLFGAGGYFLYIFSERANATGIASDAYAKSMIIYMGGAPTEKFFAIASLPAPLAATTHFGVIGGAYVTHSASTVASVMEYASRRGTATFVGARALLSRIGLISGADESWVLAGAFLSLPGAFWYDYGILGVLAIAWLSGIALAYAARIVRLSSGGGVSLAFCAAALITAILSPLISAPDSLAFPFMVLGYVGLAFYSYIVFGRRNWWLVGCSCTLVATARVDGELR